MLKKWDIKLKIIYQVENNEILNSEKDIKLYQWDIKLKKRHQVENSEILHLKKDSQWKTILKILRY